MAEGKYLWTMGAMRQDIGRSRRGGTLTLVTKEGERTGGSSKQHSVFPQMDHREMGGVAI
jgi:hypothetical protein